MDNSFHQDESETQPPRGFLASMRIIDGMILLVQHFANWLTGFVTLTEEEREEAGIYHGHQGRE